MPSLFERFGDALGPEYELERELGGGGMGIVFLARDLALECQVAIKIIRPELATARATERFLREARLLAHLKHPNIMPVHRTDEKGGFAYYVMDYCEGGTLQARLELGPLSLSEIVELGRQLLDGLEVVHRAGLVHRDIKPANVFRLGDRAVLGDFGLAVPEQVGASAPTEPAGISGTPGYTPPEQAAGEAVTARTDLYAVGVVLYEAITGRRWYAPAPEGAPDWSGIPISLRPALRRALAWTPERRWRDAASFRRALIRGAGRRVWIRPAALGAAGAIAVAAWALWPEPPDGSARRVRVRPFESRVAGRPALGDSLARAVAAQLSGSPDFAVVGPGDVSMPAAVELRGAVRADGGALCAGAQLRPRSEQLVAFTDVCAPGGAPAALADSLARFAMLALWTAEQPLLADLPRSAMPRTPLGIGAWAHGERLFNQGRWSEAHVAYDAAERADTTCWVCSWRLYFTENWMGTEKNDVRFRRFLTHIDEFPPQYRSVMGASGLPIAPRLEMLRQVTRQYPHFYFGWWFLGEEQFHRAPLVGRWRREALTSFIKATELSPAFAPGWEHLAFVATAEGDSGLAAHALEQWDQAMRGSPGDPFALVLQSQVTASFAWRFRPGPFAERVTHEALLHPAVRSSPDLGAGARHMPAFDAPLGAVWLGRRFAEQRDRPLLQKSGLLAQAFGYTALGLLDSARASLDRLVSLFPEPELALFAAEFTAAVAHLDPDGLAGGRFSPRAAAVLAELSGRSAARPGEMGGLLQALALARAGKWSEAVTRTDPLVTDPARHFGSQVLRALLHFARAEWFDRLGDPEAARRELRWAEHWDVFGFPTDAPQPAEVDWSLRTLARWRLARTLDAAGTHDQEVCLSYRRVAGAWAGGSDVFRARADTAGRRATQLSCPPGR